MRGDDGGGTRPRANVGDRARRRWPDVPSRMRRYGSVRNDGTMAEFRGPATRVTA
jgi:hypothetical protein